MTIDADDFHRRRRIPRSSTSWEHESKPNYEEQQPLSSDTPALQPKRDDRHYWPSHRYPPQTQRQPYRHEQQPYDQPGPFRRRRDESAPYSPQREGRYDDRRDADRRQGSEHREFRSRHRNQGGYADRRAPRPPQRQRPTNVTKALVRLLYASRGFALKAVKLGLVTVNDRPVHNVNAPVRLLSDEVRVEGHLLAHNPRGIYIAMNKPRKFAGSREPDSRHIMNLISKKNGWSIPCGPLAKSAGGIIVLTNDHEQGDPDNNVFALMEKEYRIKIRRPEREISDKEIRALAKRLGNADTQNPDSVRVHIVQSNIRSTWLSITVRRIRYNEMTKALHEAGFHILAVERHRIGSISTDNLPAGSWRRLSAEEVQDVVIASVRKEEMQEKVLEEIPTQTEEKNTWRTLYQRWFRST